MITNTMRSILTISLPQKDKEDLLRRAKKAGKTVSAYIKSIIDLEQNMISEDELLAMSKTAMKEYKSGKTKTLTSLKDLM